MKCAGCPWQSNGFDDNNNEVAYCIGSPHHEPKYGSVKVISAERIIVAGNSTIYRASDEDECHLWSSDRFEIKEDQPEAEGEYDRQIHR